MLHLRPAHQDELAELTQLCLRAKAVWGYDEAFMRACRAELTLTAADIKTSQVQVAQRDAGVVGVAQIVSRGALAELAKLFVEPTCLHGGVGRALLTWAVDTARRNGARTMIIESDPDAVGFYQRMGAIRDGEVASASIPGRMLPRLRLDLV
jgi:N-acetylglutamate synthase-like GNAT family acetyltransferase